MPPKKPKYTHLSQRNQILKRPGQHIGSTKTSTQEVWIAQTEFEDGEEKERIVQQEIKHNPGLVHIFYEVLGNAQDNYFRSRDSEAPLKKIDVNVDQETGEVTVWNDGLWIPTTVHEWDDDEEVIDNDDHYEAEIIFGHLNSSSNYDDDDTKRVGGGLHGVGVKLTNIYSSQFKVEAFDPDTGLKFTGVWSDNMSKVKPPKVTKLKQKRGFTKVTYTADFERFGVEGYSDDNLSVMKKLCMDCAMITGQKVMFNGENIPVKNLMSYVSSYTDGEKVEFKSSNSTVVLCEKPAYEAGLTQISWVNGINTVRSGVHVEGWKKAIFQPLLEKIKSKYSGKGKNSTPIRITMKTLEQYFMIFVNCNVENPEFDGQTKGVLIGPAPETNVTVGKINSLLKWGFINDIEETVRIQGMKELKRTDGKKTTSVSIPKADDANKAGTVKSSECTLFITEGDSAKAFAVKGISAIENGTDWFGVLPVRGKVLNVRGASVDQINANKEIAQLKLMLGLQHGVDYSDDKAYRSLRYGKIRILTDADPDGDHIKGLVINFFQYFFPSLISRGFVSSLRTPIVKATIGKKVTTFYYLKDFKDWAAKQTKFTAKYYKGLGTSQDAEILEIFEDPRHVQYEDDKLAAETVAMIFEEKRSNDRKAWLENFEEKEFSYKEKNGEEKVPISEFFNNEMIGFSIYDNQRSLPSVVDGFKPSQRKAMWVGLKVLNQTKDYKVAQFAAEVAKQSEYHHGEESMQQAIVGMAQTFVGSNNIALLFEAGQFGTRGAGGADASAARYIFTRLASIARYVLRKEDDPILDYLEEDGKKIEPKFFVPVVPMLLVNGSRGIGTAYSSNIPSFNPLELVEWVQIWLDTEAEDDEPHDEYPELKPWHWGFKGWTERDETNKKKFIHYGEVKDVGKDCYEITELPVGVWTDDYKEHLDALKSGISKNAKTGYDAMTVTQLKEELSNREQPMSGTKAALITRLKAYDKKHGTTAKKTGNSGQLITKWEWHGDAYNVNFKIWTKPGVTIDYDNPKFKLTKSEALTNMTAFTPKGGIKKYDTLDDILRTFCQVRFKYYQKRKKHLLAALKDKLAEQEAKAQFISEALDDFEILKQTEDELFEHFEEQGYWKKLKGDSDEEDASCYSYLTSIPIRLFTTDHHQKLLQDIKAIKAEIAYVKKKSPKQMWSHELDEFVKAYGKWKTDMEAVHKKLAKKKIKRFGKHAKK